MEDEPQLAQERHRILQKAHDIGAAVLGSFLDRVRPESTLGENPPPKFRTSAEAIPPKVEN